ncbi:MAG TPA: CehA/McbA family metallohydrolase [Oscillospiraceae bacterium]|nr:CehA/McbA family metallohydrolase [Oscillospiraceae bacterium]
MSSKKIVIERTFTAEDKEKYIFIPFDVPENCEKIKISFVTDKTEGICIDLGLVYPDGTQNGASGGRTKEIEISAKYSTDGYEPTEPYAGVWQIIAGVYRPKSGVTATYTIEFMFKEKRWLKGDTHTHTSHSDGNLKTEKLIAYALKKKLDYIIITDHNNTRAASHNFTNPNLTIIKGMELTEFKGHCNIWGLEKPFDEPYIANTFEEFVALAQKAKDNGGLISVNHPFCKLCGWHWPLDDFQFDAAEVWNGPMRIDNITTLNWWHDKLLKGERLPAVGGSDFHRDFGNITRLLACPTTVVYASSNSPSDILGSLKNANSVITSRPKGPMLYLECEGKTVGEEVTFHENIMLNVRGERLKKGQLLEIFNNDEIIYSEKIKSPTISFTIPVRSKGFIRAQTSYQYGKAATFLYRQVVKFMIPEDAKLPLPRFMSCITNPIWFI